MKQKHGHYALSVIPNPLALATCFDGSVTIPLTKETGFIAFGISGNMCWLTWLGKRGKTNW